MMFGRIFCGSGKTDFWKTKYAPIPMAKITTTIIGKISFFISSNIFNKVSQKFKLCGEFKALKWICADWHYNYFCEKGFKPIVLSLRGDSNPRPPDFPQPFCSAKALGEN